jgi:hypothetical protein
MCWKQTVDAYTTEYVALESVALSGDNSVYVLHYVSLHKN